MKLTCPRTIIRCIVFTILLLTVGLLLEAREGRGLFAATSPVANIPGTQGAGVLPEKARAKASVLADRDGNGLSEGLQARLVEMLPNEPVDVVVTFSAPGNAAAAQQAVGPFRVKREFKIIHGFAATVTAAQARALARVPAVFRVEEDFRVTVMLDAANRDFGTAAARSALGVSGAGVGICVVDTGVDPNHEQLDNGKVVDFVDYVNGRSAAYDDHGHGTHVSAIAAGDGDPNATFKGVAPGASIYAAKVLDASGSGSDSNVIAGVEWCADPARNSIGPGVRIISMSLGSVGSSDGRDALSQAVNNAVAEGITAVIAAGNSGAGPATVGSPGAAEQAITVGAAAEWSAPLGAPNHSDGVYLAPFSSRGPTADGRLKPDIISPGVSITSAQAGTTSGYVTWSGTSMATPFVAGTVALALQHNALFPSEVKSQLMATAQDRGPAGPDNDWGAGLLDGYAFLEKVTYPSSDPTPTEFPGYSRETGTIPAGGEKDFYFDVGEGDLGVPVAAALTVTSGGEICLYNYPLLCDLLGAWAWSPDYDAELIRVADNQTVATSECPLTGDCGTMGRQETLHFMPTSAADTGTYMVRVYQFPDDPGGIQNGSVVLDLSRGPVSASGGAGNTPPVANAGPDQSVTDIDGNGRESVSLTDRKAMIRTAPSPTTEWSEGATVIANGATPTANHDFAVGTHTITLTVTDDGNATDTDQVVITVEGNTPPVANAGPDQSVTDIDGNGTESIQLDGSNSTDSDGSITNYRWSEGATVIANGATPTANHDFAVGTHTITLTVTDNGNATDTDQVVITVGAGGTTTNTLHVADLEGSAVAKGKKARKWQVFVSVTVNDQNDKPAAGALVSGHWSGAASGTVSGTTDSAGTVTLSTGNLNGGNSVSFTVDGVSLVGYDYDAASNIKSSIVVNQ